MLPRSNEITFARKGFNSYAECMLFSRVCAGPGGAFFEGAAVTAIGPVGRVGLGARLATSPACTALSPQRRF